MKKAVLFDRDDTLIEDRVYLNDPEDIHYLKNVFPAVKSLADAGFEIFVVTNQSGVAKGIVEVKNINEIHRRIKDEFKSHGVEIKDFFYAPYSTKTKHYYRKPQPGMLNEAVVKHGLDPAQCWMVGDRMTDVEAGHRAGMKSIFFNLHEREREDAFTDPEYETNELSNVARFILEHS